MVDVEPLELVLQLVDLDVVRGHPGVATACLFAHLVDNEFLVTSNP
jgi:hypothetical protein